MLQRIAAERAPLSDATPGRQTMTDTTLRRTVATDAGDDRPLGRAVLRGLAGRCPACGRGALFERYLRVRAACPACGADLTPQRADDGPAYLAILVVGKVMAPLLYLAFVAFRPDPLLLATIFVAGSGGLALAVLPPLKGMIVAIQWSRRMHGFGDSDPDL